VSIYPSAEQFRTLLAGPKDQPVVMLNLLRFKDRADAPDAGLDGAAAYMRYSDAMRPIVEAHGGRILWTGRVDSMVIADVDPGYHAVALVEYPSRQKFLEIATSAEVAAIGVHRTAGLESQWLIATTEGSF
jgi:uncharacterized protein (DUF1330 family)